MLDRPFELVAAAGLFCGECGSRTEQRKGDEQSVAHDDQSTAIMTSEAFTTTVTWPLALMPSSSTASLVIEDVMIWPLPISTRTCEVVAPFFTSTTVPLIWLRALMRIVDPHKIEPCATTPRICWQVKGVYRAGIAAPRKSRAYGATTSSLYSISGRQE